MTRSQSMHMFRNTRGFWMRRAREYRAAGDIATASWCLDGARIAQRNLLHVTQKVPA